MVNYLVGKGENIDVLLGDIKSRWGENASTREDRVEELVCQTVMAIATDEDALRQAISTPKNKSLISKVAQALKKIAKSVYNFMKGLGEYTDRHNLQAQPWLDDVHAIRQLAEYFDKAAQAQFARTSAQSNSEQKNNTQKGAKYQISNIPNKSETEENIKAVTKMNPVAILNGSEFSKGNTDLITQVTNYFNSIGGYVNTNYGKVELTRAGVKSSIGHGIGRNKAIAFKAVPEVLKNGKIIDYQNNWKNRVYDTAVIAAPIKIADTDYFLAAVIKIGATKNTYYLHEVAIQEKEDNTLFKTGTINTAKNSTPSKALSSPINILLQKLQDVKPKFSYGGAIAKTANTEKLDKAKLLESKGETSESIRQQTGWFKGSDGKWRFEIDDSKMKYYGMSASDRYYLLEYKEKNNRMAELEKKLADGALSKKEEQEYYNLDKYLISRKKSPERKLTNYISHPQLYAAYPQLRNVKVEYSLIDERGKYNKRTNTISINGLMNDGEQEKALIHEIQHVIQGIEGFAEGASLEYWDSKKAKGQYSGRTAEDLYRSTAGEIEANDAAKRISLSEEQRKNTRPDVDREDVVFAEEKNNTYEGVQLSVDYGVNIVQQDFEKNVDTIENNTYNSDNVVIMGVTPDVLQKIGLSALPLAMTKNHIYSVAVSEARARQEGRYRKNTNYHNLGFDTVKEIYDKISNPLMVIAHPDFTDKTPRDSTHKVIVLVDLSVNGKQVIAPISVDYEGMYKNKHIDVNLVATYFDKSNINDLIKEAVALESTNKTGFYYLDKKRTQSIFKKSGYQLPSRLINSSSNIIIRQVDDNVNRKIENITQSKQFKAWFGDWQNHPESASKVVDEDGKPLVVYHGTARADRVGNVFLPERATSGPMAFFTDSNKIAQNYARDKQDTSIDYDEEYDDYYSQFRVRQNGKSVPVSELWNTLPYSKKQQIKEKARHIKWDENYVNIVYDDNAEYGNGSFDEYTINMHKGNAIDALIDSWLESGYLLEREEEFINILSMVGIDNVEYRNPNYREEKVYEAYLNIKNPFDTNNVDEGFVDELLSWYGKQNKSKYSTDSASADMWDKNNVAIDEWTERLKSDIENGTTHAWTSIPDFVTDFLKSKGYDGIKDLGGKNGGAEHTVWIPFGSTQIKSATDNIGTFDSGNSDIRYAIDDTITDSFFDEDGDLFGEDGYANEDMFERAVKTDPSYILNVVYNASAKTAESGIKLTKDVKLENPQKVHLKIARAVMRKYMIDYTAKGFKDVDAEFAEEIETLVGKVRYDKYTDFATLFEDFVNKCRDMLTLSGTYDTEYRKEERDFVLGLIQSTNLIIPERNIEQIKEDYGSVAIINILC